MLMTEVAFPSVVYGPWLISVNQAQCLLAVALTVFLPSVNHGIGDLLLLPL